jgi:hypothetical protein
MQKILLVIDVQQNIKIAIYLLKEYAFRKAEDKGDSKHDFER